MVPAFQLEEIVRDARARTGVPGVAAALHVDGQVVSVADGVLELGKDDPVRPDTPFRIASISKPFTASLALSCLPADAQLLAWLSHTAGLQQERAEPLPESAQGLFSYSNAGYWAAGTAAALACETTFEAAMRERIIEPLRLAATGFEEPEAPARGHAKEGESGHRALGVDTYPTARRSSGGLWSTAADLLRFGAHHLGGRGPLSSETRALMREPQSQALGAGYGLGWWVRNAGGRIALDHEGSIAGYQSLLLLVPDERLVLAVLTNSWRGSSLVRHVVEQLGLAASLPLSRPGVRPRDAAGHELSEHAVAGRYELDDAYAVVEELGDELIVAESETDPVTREPNEGTPVRAKPIGGGVYGYAGGGLMSHRLDFPRPGIGRIGWLALPRIER